jgi:hypothetical protein
MAGKPTKIGSLPNSANFYLNSSLYTPHTFDDSQIEEVINIISFKGPLDCYCIQCQQQSIFLIMESSGGGAGLGRFRSITGFFVKVNDQQWHRTIPAPKSDEICIRKFCCIRNHYHELVFVLRHDGQMIEKIGRYPSLADLVTAEIRKYRKLLGSDAYREFSRAVGLAAHGVGIGSFVYLRRILESLIEEAHQAAQGSKGWDESAYTDARTDEKIRLLRSYLPSFMVQNRTLYSILSKGIHELSEQECLQAFPVMKLGIELILDQKLEAQERESKISSASADIAALHSQLKGKEKGK